MKLKVYLSNTFDPWFNLALEEWIFKEMDLAFNVLYLWRNDNTVVIGRFQNPWSECHTQKMEQDNIKLARRLSGGGAVFHDLGNTNFTFLSSKENYDKLANNQIIINALKNLNVIATPSGRNDLIIETEDGIKKISGSAFKETKDRYFHHGTLLIDTNMEMLGNYLNPHPKKLQSKGIQSVKSRVINLKEVSNLISHEKLCEEIINEFFKYYDSQCEIEFLNTNTLENNPKLNEYYLKFKDWNWRFGEAPQFTHQMAEYFSWGLIEVNLNVHKAIVTDIKIFSDSLHPEMIEMLMESLMNASYRKDAFCEKINALKIKLPMYADYLEDFMIWITKEIN